MYFLRIIPLYLFLSDEDHSARFIDRFPPKEPEPASVGKAEARRMIEWAEYFTTYGNGRSMYVVDRLEELVLKGLPQKLRGSLWMLLSGAANDVSCFNLTTQHFVSICFYC